MMSTQSEKNMAFLLRKKGKKMIQPEGRSTADFALL